MNLYLTTIALQAIQDAILTKTSDIDLINSLGENYKLMTDPDQAEILEEKLAALNKKWEWLLGQCHQILPYCLFKSVQVCSSLFKSVQVC